jgi:type 1 glutamine amidotransferase
LILAAALVSPRAALSGDGASGQAVRKVIFLPGGPSHGHGAHEHFAGCKILADALNQNVDGLKAEVVKGGWPADVSLLNDAAALVVYCDGAEGHMLHKNRDAVDSLLHRGVGLVCIHFAVEVPQGPTGERFLDWIGGYFEIGWSVNPHWTAEFKSFPDHPICQGVKPFSINDEWYFQMRFRPEMERVQPILTAVPPDSTRDGRDGGRSGNDTVRARKGLPEHVAWATQRPDGGRGFGFTGGHVHWNWGHESFRKLMLNAIVWTAGMEVPPEGVPSKPLTLADLEANQDEPPPADYNAERMQKLLESWRDAQAGGESEDD